MHIFRSNPKPVACFVTVVLFVFCVMWNPAYASLVTTNEIIEMSQQDYAREKVNLFLDRADVSRQLEAYGVSSEMAKLRVASLTDAEVARISGQIDQLPAGGDIFSTLLIVSVVIFFVLLITDILGLTDIFPFVKKY
ncbi:MAG: PA2779 family protein [Desulfobacteraceae bacterium]|nr:PA2779 family protein [Desulfobacteraceae bacterium]